MTTPAAPPLTVQEAGAATGWSPRMLRYVEQLGLVVPPRSVAGHRLYGPAQVQHLRSLRDLLVRSGVELGDVAFALRLRREPELADALDDWFAAVRPAGPAPLPAAPATDPDWLAFEQDKQQQLLAPRTA